MTLAFSIAFDKGRAFAAKDAAELSDRALKRCFEQAIHFVNLDPSGYNNGVLVGYGDELEARGIEMGTFVVQTLDGSRQYHCENCRCKPTAT